MAEIGWKNNSDGQGEAYRAATIGHYFTCPECGGHYFGRDTSRDERGEIVIRETGRCQTGNCNWRGKLSEAI